MSVLRVLVCLLSFFVFFYAYAARAEGGHQTMYYDVYAGGLHVLEAEMNIDLQTEGRYSLVLGAHTRGFLGSLVPWKGTFESHGWVLDNGQYQPELHKSTSTWEEEDETNEYHYNKDGSFKKLIITKHEKEPEIRETEPELTDGTTDVLTAALLVLQDVRRGENCDGSSTIFDGKRRFKQVFKLKKEEVLDSTKYNVYSGPSQKCTVEVVPDGGAWHKKPRGWMSIQEQGRDRGTLPTLWIAKMDDDVPAAPIKILVKTAYGALFMHLTEYDQDGEVMMAQMRGEGEEEN